ncbi:MAG: hypothetical protein KA205_02355 [Acidobacteria bacterium]|nr:hypothetical protein [Acidobacteriota bacterium]
MKRAALLVALPLVLCTTAPWSHPVASQSRIAAPAPAARLHRAPPIANVVDGVTFEAGNWKQDLVPGTKGASLGNHRAVVEIDGAPAAATGSPITVTIPWRRHDPNPAKKGVVVVNATTNQVVPNVLVAAIENMSGRVAFQPTGGSQTYYIYYMPWESTGGPYPKVTYPAPKPNATFGDAFRAARVTKIQSIDAFHSFFPMEIIASPEETARFMQSAPGGWRVTAEDRDYSVRMRHYIPKHWADRGARISFSSQVLRDEYFTMQVAVVAGATPVNDVKVAFERFPAAWQRSLTCFNCGGINENGQPFTKTVNVPANNVQPLWIGMQVPASEKPGTIEGDVVITSGGVSQRVAVRLTVDVAAAINHGYDEPELMSRLAWLNSTAGTDPNFIIRPFTPVAIGAGGRTVSVIGRRVELGASGLPGRILSTFTPDATAVTGAATPVIAQPMALSIMRNGVAEPMTAAPFAVKQDSRGRASWTAASRSAGFTMTVNGALEYDGMLDYKIELTATADADVDDIVLPIAYAPGAADYLMGLGHKGGLRPTSVDWRWKVENHQEGVWMGGVNRGLQYVLRDNNYERPLNTNFYLSKPLNLPPSWHNGGKGGIRINESRGVVTATNYSGARHIAKGETLHFNVRMLMTPFKPVNTTAHFNTRFVHKYVPVDEVKADGGTVVNIHHANEINPFINYPFFNLDKQTKYIEEAHAKGVKVKLYDTIRELTYKAHELFALRSLGDEILNDGEGGGHSWMQEHMEDHYYSAWHAAATDDAAMLDKGTSRWTNYYVEGLAWLAEHQKIDGLYLDDIAFSRETVRRIVSVLYEKRGDAVIDLHSANQFNVRDGFINSGMLYMEHFPYISRLWFGEYFDYNAPPDFFMAEVSGIPFGLMGEMLQDGGHPYRGLVYGMTARVYGKTDPRPVWKMMNDFGIATSRMRGYWLQDAPVTTGRDDMRATTYLRPGKALVAIGSWSDTDQTISLTMNLKAMGFTGKVRVYAPAVEGLQTAHEVNPAAVVVPAKQGIFLRIQ